MTTRYASDVAQRLVEELLISEKEQQRAFEIIEKFWENYAMDVWDSESILPVFTEQGIPASQAAIREILAGMEKNLDYEQGLNSECRQEAFSLWEKKMFSRWLSLTDEQRAEFHEQTCGWAVIAEYESNTTFNRLDPKRSMLDAVDFAREKKEDGDPDRVRVYAIRADEQYSLEDVYVLGLLVWDSTGDVCQSDS